MFLKARQWNIFRRASTCWKEKRSKIDEEHTGSILVLSWLVCSLLIHECSLFHIKYSSVLHKIYFSITCVMEDMCFYLIKDLRNQQWETFR